MTQTVLRPDPAAIRPTEWSSWHLHLASDARSVQDRVIQEVIRPVAAELDGRPWFFMRFWQAGTHLRFRVGDLDSATYQRVEQALRDRLAEAGRLADDEEPLDEAGYRAGAVTFAATERGADRQVLDLMPPGVHRAVYEPEHLRYGGRPLMPATERLFQLSSELVVAVLPSRPSEGLRTGLGLRGTIAAAAALGGPERQAEFYRRSMEAWRVWAGHSGTTPEQLAALCAVDATGPVPDPDAHGPFRRWHAAIAELAERIAATGDTPPAQILFSHVHMLHNRLGRSLFEELRTYAWLAAAYPDGNPS
ncbi:thiopeptide-type bacteriocin biosynthesis protein [Micromonospora sp. DT231]|uniref:thiopeptide-type bacteriocin biosynthesis protein n=1 Tax=Micromonospora sp. DT231 TaxID=3416526 RepID=UPI003CF80C69